MKTILFIGDWENPRQETLLQAVEAALPKDCLLQLSSSNPPAGRSILSTASAEYARCTLFADVVVLADWQAAFRKTKYNQVVFMAGRGMIPQPHRTSPCLADVYFCTDDCPEGSTAKKQVVEASFEKLASALAQTLARELDREKLPDVLLVADSPVPSLLSSPEGVKAFLLGRHQSGCFGSTVLLGRGAVVGYVGDLFTSALSFVSDKDRIPSLLEGFSGIVVTQSPVATQLLKSYLGDDVFKGKGIRRYTIGQLKPLALGQSADLGRKPGKFTGSAYRAILRSGMQQLVDGCIGVVVAASEETAASACKTVASIAACGSLVSRIVVACPALSQAAQRQIENALPEGSAPLVFAAAEEEGSVIQAAAKHVRAAHTFFLEAGQTLHAEGLPLLAAHMHLSHAQVALGKTLQTSTDGSVCYEEEPALWGKTYRVYSGAEAPEPYLAPALGGKLVETAFLADHVAQEGGCGSFASMYPACTAVHACNVAVVEHCCVGAHAKPQCSGLERINRKVEQLEAAGNAVPAACADSWKKAACSQLYAGTAQDAVGLDEEEAAQAFALLQKFHTEAAGTVQPEELPAEAREIAFALQEGSLACFQAVLNKKPRVQQDVRPHNNYLCHTHYHVLVAMLRSIASGEPSRLFLYDGYTRFAPSLVEKLKSTGLFTDVVAFRGSGATKRLASALENCPEDAAYLIPATLNRPFQPIFDGCNFEEDTMYVFASSRSGKPWWYYVQRNFSTIVKLEDAYDSFYRETDLHELRGSWTCVEPYVGTLYPDMRYCSPNVKRIIVSKPVKDVAECYRDRLAIEDTLALAASNAEGLAAACASVYGVNSAGMDSHSVLLLTQPLSHYGYCTEEEQAALYRKMCAPYPKENLFVKPHPACRMDYSFLGGTVLPKNAPLEAYNYLGVRIAKAITFGSTALETITFATEKEMVFRLFDFTQEDVTNAIQAYIGADAKKDAGATGRKKPRKKKASLGKRVKRAIRKLLRS